MKRFVSLLATLSLLFTTLAAQAAAMNLPQMPPPQLAARAWYLLDYTSGQPLVQQGGDQRVEPASLTKLMTAYLTFAAIGQKRLALNQAIPVSEHAWRSEGSRMFIEPKRPVTVEELLHGMIIQSGNDASIALAEIIGGSESQFAQMMNMQAAKLGMKNTHFMNATGLPHPQHYTTPHDLALLAAAIVRDFPQFYPLYSKKEYSYNGITQPNRNRLLWQDPFVDGMKTGHTESAGFCLVSSAKRQDRRIIAVVVGTASDSARTVESHKLLNYGFEAFDSGRVFAARQTVTTLPVWKGSANQLKAGFTQDFYAVVPKGQLGQVKVQLTTTQPLLAPIRKHQAVGTASLVLNGKVIAERPLLALDDVSVAGFFGRMIDTVRLWFK